MNPTACASAEKPGWHPCWEQDVYARGKQLNRYPYNAVVSFVMGHYGNVPDRSRVRLLELGFGAGNNLWFAAREGFSVAGIEGAPTAVKYASDRFAADGLTGDLRVGDFSTLPWPDETFDVVLDRQSLSQTTSAVIGKALAEARRVLKPGGRLLSLNYGNEHSDIAYGTPRGNNDYDDFTDGYFAGLGTVHFFSRQEIDRTFGSCFTITSLVKITEEKVLADRRTVKALWQVEAIKETT